MNPTVIYSADGHQTDCEAEMRNGGLEAIRAYVDRIIEADAVVIAEYPDQRKFVFTAAGHGEVYIEEYHGGIAGKIFGAAEASSFLNGLLTERT
jgi:hypothetical protein